MKDSLKSIERKLPEGMRFYLPKQAEVITSLAKKGREVLKNWGYQSIFVPAMLPYDTVSEGLSDENVRQYYKLVDYRGEILVLRPEMTAAIAERLVGEGKCEEFPGRYQYFAPVYRHETIQSGKKREIYQLGAEFLGANKFADVEILMLAQKVLLNCEVDNYRLEIGHIGFLDQLLNELDISPKKSAEISSALARRDLVSYRKACRQLDSGAEDRLLKLLDLRGGCEVLNAAEELMPVRECTPVKQLRKIHRGLENLGLIEKVSYDLALTRNLDYYSGMVFEIMSPDLGYNICGGGRYDRLIKSLGGEKTPARGFAMGIERLRLIKEKQGLTDNDRQEKILLRCQDLSSLKTSVNIAEDLQELGYAVILENSEKSIGDAAQSKCKMIIEVDNNSEKPFNCWKSSFDREKSTDSGSAENPRKLSRAEVIEYVDGIS